jgi:hypothetical protein
MSRARYAVKSSSMEILMTGIEWAETFENSLDREKRVGPESNCEEEKKRGREGEGPN